MTDKRLLTLPVGNEIQCFLLEQNEDKYKYMFTSRIINAIKALYNIDLTFEEVFKKVFKPRKGPKLGYSFAVFPLAKKIGIPADKMAKEMQYLI